MLNGKERFFKKTNPQLKQDAVTEYLNELRKKYVFASIDNIALIYRNYCVTVVLKEVGILDVGNEEIKIRKKLFMIT